MTRGSYIVNAIINEFTYKLFHTRKTKNKTVHANRIKPYYASSPYTVFRLSSMPLREISLSLVEGGEGLDIRVSAESSEDIRKMNQEPGELMQVLVGADSESGFNPFDARVCAAGSGLDV